MSERIELDTGALTVAEMSAILESLPADCTFTDAGNVTRFYTGRHRIFDRSPALIGTNMIECHSEATRTHVSQIVSELATGWRDEAVFLEEKNGRQVHVRYVPVRDAHGSYLGVLEMAQWLDEICP